MKRLKFLFILIAALASLTLQAQVDGTIDKGSGWLYFTGIPGTTPNIATGSEIAINVSTREAYIWNRDSTEWKRQIEFSQGAGSPSGDPGTDPKLYLNITTGDLWQWSGAAWVQYMAGGVADGDYGDVDVSSSGTVWNIDTASVGANEIASTAVTPGAYTSANITVDADGRITAAANGGGLSGTGQAGKTTYWDTDTTLAYTSITYSATEWNAGALTGAVGLASGTTAQRPTGAAGKIRYNSDLSDLEFYNGTAWRSVAESSANAFTAGEFIIANPSGLLTDTTAAGALSMLGGVSGTGTAGRLAYWSGAAAITSDANLLWDGTELSVGTTNSAYTLEVGTGGVRITPQSAAPTGAEGVLYWDSDAIKALWMHDGTSFKAAVKGVAASWNNYRVPISDGTALTDDDGLVFNRTDNDLIISNSGTDEGNYKIQVNGNALFKSKVYLAASTNYYIRDASGYILIGRQDGAGAGHGDLAIMAYTGTNPTYSANILMGDHVTSPGLSVRPRVKIEAVAGSGEALPANTFGNDFRIWQIPDSTTTTAMDTTLVIRRSGRVCFPKYGGGTITGTPTYTAAWDANGKFVEVPEKWAAVSTTTDASGDVEVTHGLGTTPTVVLVTPTGTTAWGVTVHTIGGTTFKIRFYDLTTGLAVPVSTSVTATWLAKT